MKKALLMLLGALLALPSMARDFTYTYEGQTLTYTVIDEEAKTCTPKHGQRQYEWDYYKGNAVGGELIIPAIAKDGEREFFVISISDGAFYGNADLISVRLPRLINAIGKSAFNKCYGLTSINLPDSIIEIREQAFRDCHELKTIIIPHSVKTIKAGAFRDCINLTSVIVGKGVTSLGVDDHSIVASPSYIFSGCNGLKKAAFPKRLGIIFENSGASDSLLTFAYDPELYIVDRGLIMHQDETKMILDFAIADGHYSVPDSITAIGDNAFAYCDSLSSIIISPYVTEVGEDVFMGCDNLQKGAYPDAVENPFGEDVLAICFDAYDSAVENDFVYSRRKNALYFAPLDIESSFTVPETVTEITDNAFGLCSTLESIVLPEGLIKLGTKVWDGCPDIMHVVCKSAEPAAATRDLFQVGVYDNATLYVPKGSRAKYESAVPWKYFYNITEDEFNGIEEVEAESGTIREEYGAEIFNLNGVKVADSADGLPAGIYIVRQGAKTEKIVVK